MIQVRILNRRLTSNNDESIGNSKDAAAVVDGLTGVGTSILRASLRYPQSANALVGLNLDGGGKVEFRGKIFVFFNSFAMHRLLTRR